MRILVAGSLLFLALPCFGISAQQYTTTRSVDTTVTIERGSTLRVSLFAGRVDVTGASGSAARIRGEVQEGEVRLRTRASTITVDASPDRGSRSRATLDISVPFGTNVVIEGYSAPVSVRGVRGKAKVETLSGSVAVEAATGGVSVQTVSGSITVSASQGDISMESVSGRLDASNIDGDIEGSSVSGRISVVGARAKSVKAETVSGAVEYSGAIDQAGTYTFKSHSGRLTLVIPANTGATLNLKSFSGHASSDFPVTLQPSQWRKGTGTNLEFRLGNGRSRIVAETFSGNVVIKSSSTTENRE